MNKHRNKDRRFSIAEMVLLCIAAPVLMGGGFVHAWLKNSQVEVVKEIRKAETRIIELNSSIEILQEEIIKEGEDRDVLLHNLKLAKSKLVLRPANAMTKIPPYSAYKADEMPSDLGIAGVQQ